MERGRPRTSIYVGEPDYVSRPKSWTETIDITNDYLADYPRNITDWARLSTDEYYAIGGYLISSGLIVGIANLLGMAIIIKYPRALMTPSAVPEMGLLLADLAVGGLHPFSGSSALANRWLWGPVGCQLYALSGFLFGLFQNMIVHFIALDRYIVVCKPSWGSSIRNWQIYGWIFFLCFADSLLFSIAPFIFFSPSQYGMMPTKTVCTINYYKPQQHFPMYIYASLVGDTKFLEIFAVPMMIGVFSTMATVRRLGQPHPPRIFFAKQNKYGRVLLACMLITPVTFTPYAIASFTTIFMGPNQLPRWLGPGPAILVKLAGLLNPLAFLWANPLHWACLKKLFGRKHNTALIKEAEMDNEGPETRREREAELASMVQSSSYHH